MNNLFVGKNTMFQLAINTSSTKWGENCANCNVVFSGKDKGKSTKLTMKSDGCVEKSDVQIVEALSYIFDISWSHFSLRYAEDNNCPLQEINSITLCKHCSSCLLEVYNAYCKFDGLSQQDSLLRNAKQWLRNSSIENETVPLEPKIICKLEENETSSFNPSALENAYAAGPVDGDSFDSLQCGLDEEVDSVEAQETKYVPPPPSEKTLEDNANNLINENKTLVVQLENMPSKILKKFLKANRKRKHRYRLRSDGAASAASTHNTHKNSHRKKMKSSPKKSYKCRKCNKAFSIKNLLTEHRKTHKVKDELDVYDPGPYSCHMCGKVSNYKKVMREHIRLHDPNREKFICETCGKVYRSKYFLTGHLQRAHVTAEERQKTQTPCKICGKLISPFNRLHILRHKEPDKKYNCDVCNKSYLIEYELTYHRKLAHSAYTSFTCEICGKCFNMKRSFTVHMQNHNKEKTLACDVCPKMYKTVSELNRHKQSHSGERPFGCEKCGKTFRNNQHFRTHMKIHDDEQLGEEAFKCAECNKTFKHGLLLYKHQVKFHRTDLKKTVYDCKYCGKILSCGTVLRRHIYLHESGKFPNATTSSPNPLNECDVKVMQ